MERAPNPFLETNPALPALAALASLGLMVLSLYNQNPQAARFWVLVGAAWGLAAVLTWTVQVIVGLTMTGDDADGHWS